MVTKTENMGNSCLVLHKEQVTQPLNLWNGLLTLFQIGNESTLLFRLICLKSRSFNNKVWFPVVQTCIEAICCWNHYPLDEFFGFVITQLHLLDDESSFSFKNNLSEMFTTNGRGNVLWKPDVLAKENKKFDEMVGKSLKHWKITSSPWRFWLFKLALCIKTGV